jgi:hypothetical protein
MNEANSIIPLQRQSETEAAAAECAPPAAFGPSAKESLKQRNMSRAAPCYWDITACLLVLVRLCAPYLFASSLT